jgi:hypothetical protein
MKTKIVSLCAIALKLVSVSSLQAATISLSAGTYTENFNSITTTAPSGWDVRTSASSTTLGTVGSYTATIGTVTAWNDTTSGFKNFASSNSLTSAASSAAQNATTDRALGLRQSGSFGDPGASLNFNFSSSSLTVSSITIDLEMLSVQTRSTVWTIQYGIGAAPTSFTTLATFSDPGTFGSTTLSFTTSQFGTNLDNRSQAWFRVVALSAATGSGNRDSFGINNFSITAIPETSTSLLGFLGALGLLRRRRL